LSFPPSAGVDVVFVIFIVGAFNLEMNVSAKLMCVVLEVHVPLGV